MPEPDPPPLGFEETLQQIYRQQRQALESYQLLTQSHLRWQKSVEDLLTQDTCKNGQWRPLEAPYLEPPHLEPPRDSLFVIEPFKLPEDPDIGSPGTGSGKPQQLAMSHSTVMGLQCNDTAKGPLKKLVAEIIQDQEAKSRKQPLGFWGSLQSSIAEFVVSPWFEYITGFVILLNMITIGIEAEMAVYSPAETWAADVERVFLALYTIEIALRIIALGQKNLQSLWFFLDFFLVGIGLLARVIVPIFGEGADLAGFEKLLLVRCLRLLRLVRALRMVSHFKVMWRLVYSLLTAGQTLLSTSVLTLLSLFIFGCVALEFITKDPDLLSNEETAQIVRHHFADLGTSILTLTQFVTLDSVAAVYYPLVVAKPLLVIYFGPILFIVSIGLMNLVTAVLVENSLEHAAHEAESERLQLKKRIRDALPVLLNTFDDLDIDKSGCLTKEEVENVPIDILPPKLLEQISIDSMVELFELLDVDGSDQLTKEEFVEGLLSLVLLDVPISTIQSLRLLRLLREMSLKMDNDIQALHAMINARIGEPVRL